MENTEEIIQRHLNSGHTKEEALEFIKKVKLMKSKGLITEEEYQRIMKTATIDMVG